MAGETYIAMTGDNNELWAECLERGVVALSYGKPYFEAWSGGDYDEFLRLERKAAEKGASESDVRGRATTWYKRATLIAESEDDLWLHRADGHLYWAVSRSDDVVFEEYDGKVMIAKPVTPWSRRNLKTAALSWNSIHPKARGYLAPLQAVFRVADPMMKAYVRALVDGESLDQWHERPDWKLRLGEDKGKSLGVTMELSEFVLTRMMLTIRDTVRNAKAEYVLRTLKDKKLLCTEAEMKARLAFLMEEQKGLCKITGLPMHVDGQEGLDKDMMASVDRIDSSGHYALDNVQLVCRFVNFWKCAQDNDRFIELLDKVVAHRSSAY